MGAGIVLLVLLAMLPYLANTPAQLAVFAAATLVVGTAVTEGAVATGAGAVGASD